MSEDHVYAIAAGERAMKIGRAWQPHSRLKDLQTAHYEKLTLECTVEYTEVEALAIERECHRQLRGKRLYGEWFRILPVEAQKVIDDAVSAVRRGEVVLKKQVLVTKRGIQLPDKGRLVLSEDVPGLLGGKEARHFCSEEEVEAEKFLDLAASVLQRGFNLTRQATFVARAIIRVVCDNRIADRVALNLAIVRQNGGGIRGAELNKAIAELLKNQLINATGDSGVYSINRKYFTGSGVVQVVTVHDLKKSRRKQKDAAA